MVERRSGRSGWLPEVDALRGLLAVGVVVAHAVNGAQADTPLAALDRICVVTVPAFLAIAAFLAFRRHPEGPPPGYLWSRVARVGGPYALWATVYTVAASLHSGRGWPSAKEVAVKVLGGPFDLYFIPIVLQFYALFSLMRHEPLRRRAGGPWAVLASLAATVGFDAAFAGPWRDAMPRFYVLVAAWLVHFHLGAWLAGNWDRLVTWVRRRRSAVLAAASAGVAILGVSLPRPAAFEPEVQLATPLILPALILAAGKVSGAPWVHAVARLSFGLYLTHRLAYYAVSPAVDALPPYAGFAAALFVQGAFGLGTTWLLERIPGLGWTVGAPSWRPGRRRAGGREQDGGAAEGRRRDGVGSGTV